MASSVDTVQRNMQPKRRGLSDWQCAGCLAAFRKIVPVVGLLAMAIAVWGMLVVCTPIAFGQPGEEGDEQREYNVKLAYLCNFGRYIIWPADAAPAETDGEWIIGVLGEDPFRGALDQIATSGRKIMGRTIVVRHFASMEDYKRCHILFIPKTVPGKQQEAAIDALRDKPVLVVGETPGFATVGGCVNFYLDGENVRFEINSDAVSAHHLQASAKLLALAKIVKRS